MITVGQICVVLAIVGGIAFIAGLLVFLAWYADQPKADQTKGGEE